ncbi:MAG: glycerol-3-phosphate 1-O-acyltransferase PlsY [Candidatus Omnitrophota bacterium]|nr:glycerol-3-phosphate 1-O-acyltransferase PlsY [Candidatus Omnitrophota bacterium]
MISWSIPILAAYILGSLPTAYLAGKAFKGIDIREFGSGNVGATNVFRSVGRAAGIFVFVLDVLKGAAAVILIPLAVKKIDPNADILLHDVFYIALGAAVVAGHIWTCFLKFKGGKGVATTAGVMAGLSPAILGICLLIWVIIFSIWKFVSLASISSAVSMPVLSVVFGKSLEFTIFTAVICIVGVYAHRSNIRRLIQGTENRLVSSSKS